MDVNDFMQKLSAQAASASKSATEFKQKTRVLEKISLNFPGNHGRYQIFPVNSVVEDYPFVTLFGTREICIPRKSVAADGTENVFNAWIKLLPKNGYRMKDLTGRSTSSLTAEEEQILDEANTVFDQLYEEVDAKNNVEIAKNLLRRRNYTIFCGYCLNRWDFDTNNRAPVRQNFSGLFVCTAKGFTQAVNDNVQEKALMNGGDIQFIDKIYGRQTTNHDGYMIFSLSRSKTSAGYNVTVNHEWGHADKLSAYSIPKEDLDLMSDPVENFLGWQANKDDAPEGSKRLFNASLIKEAIAFMTEQLAAVRMAKQNGTSMEEAVKATNATALANSPAIKAHTNDPMLQEMSAPSNNMAQNVTANNNAPFQTPPAAHIDPTTSAPVNNNSGFGGFSGFGQQGGNSAPFSAPNFAAPSGADNSGLPF